MDSYRKRKPGRRSKYTHNFIQQAVKYILENDLTERAAGKHFDVSHGQIHRWIKAVGTELVNLKSIGTMAALSPSVHGDDNCYEQIKLLQNALEMAQLKVTGLETIIDLLNQLTKLV